MTQPVRDPMQWFTELLKTQPPVQWPTGTGPVDLKAVTQHWNDSVAAITKWQLDTINQLTSPWTAALAGLPGVPGLAATPGLPTVPGFGTASEPIKDRRFADEAWSKDPRYEALARTYLTQTELMYKALDAAPLDERSKAQWGFALRQITDALSPANNLATNPEAHATRPGNRRHEPGRGIASCSPRTWPRAESR